MDSFSPFSCGDAEQLLSAFTRVCDRAAAMKCVHENCARSHSKHNKVLFGTAVIVNALAAFLLAGGFRDMLPRTITTIAALLSALAAICTGLALTFDYKGKAGRHSELSTCYAALSLGCRVDIDRFRSGHIAAMQFDTILGCNVNILKELELRSYGLDSSCTTEVGLIPANQPLQPTSGVVSVG